MSVHPPAAALQPLSTHALKAREGEDLIVFEGLQKAFGPKRVYDGLDLTVRRGETLTVIGGSGTGKSVLLKCLIGLLTPDAGSIRFDGRELVGLTESAFIEVRRQIGMLFQGAALFDSLDVGENVAYPIREHFPHIGPGELADRVAQKLEMVGLPGIEKMRPADLSGGMKKRVGLARAIAIDPAVVLYDEPTTGLDPVNTKRIGDLILSLRDRLNCTSLVVTHDMTTVFQVSDRVAFVYNGRIGAVGDPESLRRGPDRMVRGFMEGDPAPFAD